MKVLLLTLHSQNNNFGSVLQANSLYSYMADIGYDVTVLNYQPYYSNGATNPKMLVKKAITNTLFLPQYIKRSIHFNQIIRLEKTTKKCPQYDRLEKIASEYDVLMIGSDQIWNPHYLCGKDPAYTLQFSDSKKKLTYAASVGTNDLSENEIHNIVSDISDFRFVSVREQSSAIMLRDAGRRDALYVLDPVFLYDVEHYRNIQKNTKEKSYILAYVIHKDPFIEEVIAEAAKKLNKRVIQVGGFASKCKSDRFPRSAGPAEFLGLLDGADYVITSSFHGTAFSLLYHKQFLIVMPHANTLRLTNILESAGTEDRVATTIDDVSILKKAIDYESVDKRLNKLRTYSEKYLIQALKSMEEL